MGVPLPTERGADQSKREGVVISLEGLTLPEEFELRDGEDNRFLYHNVCGNRIATLSLHAGPDAVSHVIERHWCPREGTGVGAE